MKIGPKFSSFFMSGCSSVKFPFRGVRWHSPDILHHDSGNSGENEMIYYYVDKLRFYSELRRDELMPILNPIKHLAGAVNILPNKYRHQSAISSFKSIADIAQPSPAFLEQLSIRFKDFFPFTCPITYLELARDMTFDSEEAAMESYWQLMRTTHPNRRTEFRYATADGSQTAKGCHSRLTKYGGKRGRGNQYVLYCRQSKKADSPCVHEEFKLNGAPIKNKLGINNFQELAAANLEQLFEKFYAATVSRYEGELDVLKLEMFLAGMHKATKPVNRQEGSLPDRMRSPVAKRQLAARSLMQVYDAWNIPAVVSAIREEQKKIRHKSADERTPAEEHILAFNGNWRQFKKDELL